MFDLRIFLSSLFLSELLKGRVMKTLLCFAALLFAPLHLSAQSDWRFGFEYNENWPFWSPRWAHPAHEQLLAKLAEVTSNGAINVNGMGNWSSIQSSANAEYNFKSPDSIVRLFQSHGFELTWYLNCEARWAWVNPNPPVKLGASMAPAPDREDDWQNFVRAVVERYDGDGTEDMPGLLIPIRFYIMTGEIKFDKTGLGDQEDPPFWADTIESLLRLHRLTYAAIREADPSGNTKLVSSGAVLWDLYADFPDYPEFDPAQGTLPLRLLNQNYKSASYVNGWRDLKKMLASFGNDNDGLECDYIGWHPHFSWRVIDQEFKLIRSHAGNKPIYVDDMWCNIFAQGYFVSIFATIPGEAQFNAPPLNPPPPIGWIKRLYGDFPNALFPSLNPHDELRQGLKSGNATITGWYEANGARQVVKSMVSAFGESAERASFSGTNDVAQLRNAPFEEIGWINLTGTRQEGYREKAQFYTYKLLVEKLRDFISFAEINVSTNPRTRVYKFERSRGPIYVLWSETGDAPPNLDYDIPTGETVSFSTTNAKLLRTRIITSAASPFARVDTIIASNNQATLQLGYEPFFLEPIGSVAVDDAPLENLPRAFALRQSAPNPFHYSTHIGFAIKQEEHVRLEVFDLNGRRVRLLLDERKPRGEHEAVWEGRDERGACVRAGIYFYRLTVGHERLTRKVLVAR